MKPEQNIFSITHYIKIKGLAPREMCFLDLRICTHRDLLYFLGFDLVTLWLRSKGTYRSNHIQSCNHTHIYIQTD